MAAVTFDDGYRDVYEHAVPLLQRKGIPAAVFVVTDLIGTTRPPLCDRLHLLLTRAFTRWPDAAARVGRLLRALEIRDAAERIGGSSATVLMMTVRLLRSLPRSVLERLILALEADIEVDPSLIDGMLPMTWEMLTRMKRAGIVVGSHTKSHALLPLERPAIVAEELLGARVEIERRLGGPVRHFAYPDGQFTRTCAAAVSAAGYRFAYTTCTYRDPEYPLLTLPRLMLWENACLDARAGFSPAIMNCHMHGVFDLVRGCEHEHRA
jgi:peptidoglycan/xylan/chitin deacetylase (PgdA/CDA1 family)